MVQTAQFGIRDDVIQYDTRELIGGETSKNGFFQENRKHQEIKRFHNHIKSYLINNFYSDKNILQKINDYEQLIESHQIDVYTAANSIINQNFSLIDKNEKSNSK